MKSPWSVPNDDIALSHYQGGIQIPGFEYTSISNWLDLNVSQTKTLICFPTVSKLKATSSLAVLFLLSQTLSRPDTLYR